jgi:hypothetical protein
VVDWLITNGSEYIHPISRAELVGDFGISKQVEGDNTAWRIWLTRSPAAQGNPLGCQDI